MIFSKMDSLGFLLVRTACRFLLFGFEWCYLGTQVESAKPFPTGLWSSTLALWSVIAPLSILDWQCATERA